MGKAHEFLILFKKQNQQLIYQNNDSIENNIQLFIIAAINDINDSYKR